MYLFKYIPIAMFISYIIWYYMSQSLLTHLFFRGSKKIVPALRHQLQRGSMSFQSCQTLPVDGCEANIHLFILNHRDSTPRLAYENQFGFMDFSEGPILFCQNGKSLTIYYYILLLLLYYYYCYYYYCYYYYYCCCCYR